MIITSAEKNSKEKGMYSIFIDNIYTFSIEEEDYFRLKLYENREIENEEIESIRKNILVRAAKNKAVKFMALKLRSRLEVSQKLLKEGFDELTIEFVLDQLQDMGYIDDKRYAEKYILHRHKLKPTSSKFIRYELSEKGISEEIINENIEGYELYDLNAANQILNKKFKKCDLNDEKTYNKAYIYLKSKGFSHHDIINAVEEFMQNKN